MKIKRKQTGAVLIMVLWMIMLALILITAIAANIRLSAITVINHQKALSEWNLVLETINKAHMELLISKMNKPEVQETSLYKERLKNTFMGQTIELKYQTPEGLTVRIYDMSGKININGLNETTLKQLLGHRLGEFHKQIPELVDAWFDWIDADELKRLNGAEKQYYQKQSPPYTPANKRLTSVDEILLIKGFKTVFQKDNLNSLFTTYQTSGGSKVNPNIASREVLLMIPGVDNKIAGDIIKAREMQLFKNINELDILLPPSIMSKAKNWFGMNVSQYFAIAIYPTEHEVINLETGQSKAQTVTAYVEEVRLINKQTLPIVLKVTPNAQININ